MTTPDTGIPESPAISGLTFRGGRTDDWETLAEVMNRGNAADGVEEAQSGEELATEHAKIDDFDVARDVLVAEADGTVIGFASGQRVVRDEVLVGETWGAVDPAFRRRGLATALFEATRVRLATELVADPRPGPRELRSFAMDLETGARGLLADRGFVPIRYGFEMRRFLTGTLPDRALPAGIEMRPVTPGQHRVIFDADNEAFEDHWGHRPPSEGDFVAQFEGPSVDTSLWCVAWDGDQVAGVVMNAIIATENERLGVRRGWLDHVSVRRPWRGRGVAKALCAASMRVLRERDMDEAWLGVDGENPMGALALYEGLGFQVARRWQAYGRPVDAPAPAGWRPAGARPT